MVFISCNSVRTANGQKDALQGASDLSYISGPQIVFSILCKNDTPTITFDLKENRVSGKNSCNSYSGTLNVDANETSFKGPIVVTNIKKPPCFPEQGGLKKTKNKFY